MRRRRTILQVGHHQNRRMPKALPVATESSSVRCLVRLCIDVVGKVTSAVASGSVRARGAPDAAHRPIDLVLGAHTQSVVRIAIVSRCLPAPSPARCVVESPPPVCSASQVHRACSADWRAQSTFDFSTLPENRNRAMPPRCGIWFAAPRVNGIDRYLAEFSRLVTAFMRSL